MRDRKRPRAHTETERPPLGLDECLRIDLADGIGAAQCDVEDAVRRVDQHAGRTRLVLDARDDVAIKVDHRDRVSLRNEDMTVTVIDGESGERPDRKNRLGVGINAVQRGHAEKET